MKNPNNKRLPKILKIKRIEKKDLRISVLFSDGEDRILDFNSILKEEWKVTKDDPEYKLLNPNEFAKVKIANHTLSWDNVDLYITDLDRKKKKVPFEVGADTLYELSSPDGELNISLGSLLKQVRLKLKLSQEKVAELSGTSRTYITRLENDKQDIEIKTLKKIVEAGLNKHLLIAIK
ncbi:MAG TPA: helix-turn-helix transcriptional regulator [Cytophagaceae bacterium]|jgi:DNA-binding XRE family transcriptional regulator|nr:helix-turn-helix transcriptional regulator [Cytophagaceae bacterium]